MSVVPFDDAITAVADLIGKFIPDKTQAATAQAQFRLALMQAQSQETDNQLQVDKQEAASVNWFVAGPRPFIMWTCGLALVYQYLVLPIGTWGMLLAHVQLTQAPPSIDGTLWQLLFGLLGLGGLRTYEKIQGVQGNH